MYPTLVLGCLLVASNAFGQFDDLAANHSHRKQGLADMMLEYMDARYPDAGTEGHVLYVSVQRQRLFHVIGGRMSSEYTISTARNGLGERLGSNRTPNGLHRVVAKYGAGVPLGGVFRERQYTGTDMHADTTGEDLVTSRILWLGGMEPGVNQGGQVDSKRRAIYIHGTKDEATLGTPASHGCIRMSNSDVAQLFERTPLNALVVILDN